VVAADALVSESTEPELAGLLEDGVTLLEFHDCAAGFELQDVAVRLRRHLHHGAPHGPIPLVQLDHGAAGEARVVGGEVVGSRLPHRPVHEIGARIVGIGVVVEEVADRKAAHDERDAVDVTLACELVGTIGDILLLTAEPKGLLEVVALRPDPRERRAGLLGFAIRKSGNPKRAVEAEALRELRVEIELAALPKPDAEERGRGPGLLKLSAAGQAVRARIGRAERRIALRQERRLRMNVPAVRFRQQALVSGSRLPRRVTKMLVEAD